MRFSDMLLRMALPLMVSMLLLGGCSTEIAEDTTPPSASNEEGSTTTGQNDGSGEDDVCSGGELGPREAWELLNGSDADSVVFLDIRTETEFEDGHVPGARSFHSYAPDIDERLDELPRDTTYIVYCLKGVLSARFVDNMESLGFTSVCSIEGGWNKWNSSGLPVAEGPE